MRKRRPASPIALRLGRRDSGALHLAAAPSASASSSPSALRCGEEIPNVGSRPSARARAPADQSLFALGGPPMRAATLPTGFTESLVASGLANPTAMQFAPDGRLFVAEQGGRLRVIKDGALLPTPFLTVTVSSVGERGLLGVAFDPQFRRQPVRVRLLHGDDPGHSQPHQPLHRQRRRRGRRAARSSSSSSTISAARPITTAARCTSVPTASCTRPSARTRTARTRRR